MISLIRRRLFSTSTNRLAGHSKWANIKHDKAKNDALKNTVATKHSKSITVATKIGGGSDPTINFQLATAIELANKANVSKKVIENAIKRGSGVGLQQTGSQLDFAVYEGMADGVSFIVEALTDNKARAASNVKVCFTKLNGNFSPTMFMFNKRGFIKVDHSEANDNDAAVDGLFDDAIEAGATDIHPLENDADSNNLTLIVTEPQDCNKVVQELKKNYKVVEFGLEYAANEDTAVPKDSLDDERMKTLDKLVNNLENVDEVVNVYSNVV